MVRIAHIGDIHISGKNYDRAKEALSQAARIINEKGVHYVVCSGDVFDKGHYVADRYKSVGDLQGLLVEFLKNQLNGQDVYLLEGNHDQCSSHGGSSLRAFDIATSGPSYPRIFRIGQDGYNKCRSRRVKDVAFMHWGDDLPTSRPKILFGHCDVIGHKCNEGHTITESKFGFTPEQLKATGADCIRLSHIHKRGGFYVGALYQNNFGEEGNPQGFEIITLNNEKGVEIEYCEIDMEEYKTFKIRDINDLKSLPTNYIRKLRFECKEVYDAANRSGLIRGNDVVEIEAKKSSHRSRTEVKLNSETMGIKQVLEEYNKIEEAPVSLERMLEVIK